MRAAGPGFQIPDDVPFRVQQVVSALVLDVVGDFPGSVPLALVTALAVGKIDGELVVDLSGIEDKAGDADLPIAITWYNDEISLLQFDGDMDLAELDIILKDAKEAANKIYEIQVDTLKNKYISIQKSIEKEIGGED